MKKSIIPFMLGILLMIPISGFAESYFQFVQSQNTLYVDGVKVDMPLYNYNYTNHAPIRAVAEAVGLDVKVTGTRIDFTSPLTDLETVAKNCKDSCVMIYAKMPNGTTSQGSGWVYNGYVITATHVIKGAREIQVFMDGSIYGVYGTIQYLDPDLDIAVIKASTNMPSVTLGDSDELKEGQKLVSITSPMNVMNVIDECVCSGIKYSDTGYKLTVSESNIVNGSSGGAVFNYDGEIIAMAASGPTELKDVANIVPINQIKPILEKLK